MLNDHWICGTIQVNARHSLCQTAINRRERTRSRSRNRSSCSRRITLLIFQQIYYSNFVGVLIVAVLDNVTVCSTVTHIFCNAVNFICRNIIVCFPIFRVDCFFDIVTPIAIHGMLPPINVASTSVNFSSSRFCIGIVWAIVLDTAIVHTAVAVGFGLLNMHGQLGVSLVFPPILLQIFVVRLLRILQKLVKLLVCHLPMDDLANLFGSIGKALLLYKLLILPVVHIPPVRCCTIRRSG